MDNMACDGLGGFGGNGGFDCYECALCGNHVCFGYVRKNGAVCPHCFGRMYVCRN